MRRRGIYRFAITALGEVVVTAGSGHYHFVVPALAVDAAVRNGDSSSDWWSGGIARIAGVVVAAIGLILFRRVRGSAAKA